MKPLVFLIASLAVFQASAQKRSVNLHVQNNVEIGQEDSEKGTVHLRGSASDGGWIQIDTAGDHDSTISDWTLYPYEDDLRIAGQGAMSELIAVVIDENGKVSIGNVLSVPNAGLKIRDTDASHYVIVKPGSNLTSDRTVTLTTGDADRTLTLNGSPTLSDWFDQSVKAASKPTFAGIAAIGGNIEMDNALILKWKNSTGTLKNILQVYTDNNLYLENHDGNDIIIRANGNGDIQIPNGSTLVGTTDASDLLAGTAKFKVVTGATEYTFGGIGAGFTNDGTTVGEYLTHPTEGVVFGSSTDDPVTFRQGNVEALVIDTDRNLKIPNTQTAPISSTADSVQLWAEDVASSSELKVRDEGGNVTTISPHHNGAPNWLYDYDPGFERVEMSLNVYAGVIEYWNESRRGVMSNETPQAAAARRARGEHKTYCRETFSQFNARNNLEPGDRGYLQVIDWDTQELANEAIADAAIERWKKKKQRNPGYQSPKPLKYQKRPKPDWVDRNDPAIPEPEPLYRRVPVTTWNRRCQRHETHYRYELAK